jgi:predicted PurR-regulated permease PerM
MMQSNRWLQILIIQLVIIASAIIAGQVLSILAQFSNIILLFFMSWLLAFVLSPIVRTLTTRGLSKGMAVAVVYGVLALLVLLAGVLLVPAITQQIGLLIVNFEDYRRQLEVLVVDMQNTLVRDLGFTAVDLEEIYNSLAGQVQGVAFAVLQNTFSVLQSVATLAFQVVLVVLISFYFLIDGDRIGEAMINLLPPAWRDEIRLVALSVTKSFGGFIRGQLIFGLVYAILTAIVMMMPPFQLEFVVVASLVAGLCMLIPLIGNFLAFVPPMLVCLITPSKVDLWPWLLLALFVAQSIMMNVLGPRIMSSAIGIHPLFVMAALLIGGQIAGFWGALFGIPVAGALNLIGRPVMRRLRHQSPIYQEDVARSPTTGAFVTGPLAASFVDSIDAAEKAAHTRAAEVVVETQVSVPAQAPISSSPDSRAAVAGGTSPESPESPAPVAAQSLAPAPGNPIRAVPAAAYDDDDDFVAHRTPTLSARATRYLLTMGGRAFDWARERTQAKVPRN